MNIFVKADVYKKLSHFQPRRYRVKYKHMYYERIYR